VKRYEVIVQPLAEKELREAFEFIRTDSPNAAATWLRGLYEVVKSMETLPKRFAFAREREDVNADVRQTVYHSHRILFTVEDKTVFIHHIRHAKIDSLEALRTVKEPMRKKKT